MHQQNSKQISALESPRKPNVEPGELAQFAERLLHFFSELQTPSTLADLQRSAISASPASI